MAGPARRRAAGGECLVNLGHEWDLHSGLLDTVRRIGVWPDSVQVSGGMLSSGLPTRDRVWLTFGLQPAGHRDEAWLKRGLPCS